MLTVDPRGIPLDSVVGDGRSIHVRCSASGFMVVQDWQQLASTADGWPSCVEAPACRGEVEGFGILTAGEEAGRKCLKLLLLLLMLLHMRNRGKYQKSSEELLSPIPL